MKITNRKFHAKNLLFVMLLFPLCLYGQTVVFNNTDLGAFGSMQFWTVPSCVDSISIEVWGAQGGGGDAGEGGRGARIKGDFDVTPGQILKILVGQMGSQCGNEGGGGGGTFVTDILNNPLVVAGGGGGSSLVGIGTGGTVNNCGNPGNGGVSPSQGGCSGNGGNGSGINNGSSGGGLLTDGLSSTSSVYPCISSTGGGKSFINGGNGGTGNCAFCNGIAADGGFGGGGGTYGPGSISGGGGGGYSGGGAGSNNGQTGGGGGGSYNIGANQSNSSDVKTGHGQAVITILSQEVVTASITATNVSCNGGSDGALVVTATGGAGNYSYSWNNGATSALINNIPSGNYNVTVTDAAGCSDMQSVILTEPPALLINASAPAICSNASGTVTASVSGGNPGYSFLWSNGQTASTITILAPGTFFLTVSDNLGCILTFDVVVAENAVPVASFARENICLNDTSVFTNTSIIANGSITGWNWIFGDGASASSVPDPLHSYDTSGVFTVELIVTSDKGCMDTMTAEVTVNPVPTAAFTSDNVCIYDTARFINNSTITSGTISYSWDLGDGTIAAQQNPPHLYVSDGSYNVLLTV